MNLSALARMPAVALAMAGIFLCAPGMTPARAGEMQGEAGTAQPEKAPPLPPRPSNSTADHSKYEALKGPFANGSGGHEGMPDLP